jgi:cytochrome P450
VEGTEIKGIKFTEGMIAAVDAMSLHFNPEYWGLVDPNEFYPLRFSEPGINKQAYMPFGIGPRQCVGKKTLKKEIFN